MRVSAVRVSVAHMTLLIIITYVNVKDLNMYVLIIMMNKVRQMKPIIVPIMPKKNIILKF